MNDYRFNRRTTAGLNGYQGIAMNSLRDLPLAKGIRYQDRMHLFSVLTLVLIKLHYSLFNKLRIPIFFSRENTSLSLNFCKEVSSQLLRRFFFILFIALFSPRIAPAFADSLTDRLNTPIDVIVLVDSSASMRLSDPEKIRQKAVSGFVDSLGPHDRIALAEFSDSARLLVPFKSPSSSQSLSSQISNLGDSGEFTDILAAVNLGSKVLNDSGRAGVRRVLVLLSDGKMDPSPQQYSSSEAIDKLLTKVVPELKAEGIVIHSIALSDEADRALMSEIAARTDGVGWFAQDPSAIEDILRDLLFFAKRLTDGELFTKTISIEENEEATIFVRKIPGAQLSIRSPSGASFKNGMALEEGEQWFENDEFALLTLKKPEIGEWIVEGLRDPDEFVEILRDLKATVRWPSALFVGSRAIVEAILLEGARPISIPALSRAMRATVRIVPTDRIAEPIVNGDMFDDGTEGDGIAEDGVFTRDVIVQSEGAFKVRITLRGPTFEESVEQPFQVSKVLMHSTIELTDKSFATLTKDYKKVDREHGGSAQGSHGAGGHGDNEATPSSNEGPIKNSNTAHDSSSPSPVESVPTEKEVLEHKNPYIRIELEPEVFLFRRHVVSVVVLDEEGKEFPVKLYPSRESDNVLLGNLTELPKPGAYQAQARLTVKPKWGAEQQYLGPWLPFEYAGKIEIHEKVEETKHTKQEQEEPTSYVGPIGSVLFANLLIGGGFFLLLKRQSKGGQVGEAYSLPSGFEEMISNLERIADESDISPDDPRFRSHSHLSEEEMEDNELESPSSSEEVTS
jgi:hypothetical protein